MGIRRSLRRYLITGWKEPAALLILGMLGVSCAGGCADGTRPQGRSMQPQGEETGRLTAVTQVFYNTCVTV